MDVDDPTTVLLYESEAPDGFLVRLEAERVFDMDQWRTIWGAVGRLIADGNGSLDVWAQYDLTRIIASVQDQGMELVGRSFESLDEFERQVLTANLFIKEALASF